MRSKPPTAHFCPATIERQIAWLRKISEDTRADELQKALDGTQASFWIGDFKTVHKLIKMSKRLSEEATRYVKKTRSTFDCNQPISEASLAEAKAFAKKHPVDETNPQYCRPLPRASATLSGIGE